MTGRIARLRALHEAVEGYIDWQYRLPEARRVTMSDLRVALAACDPEALPLLLAVVEAAEEVYRYEMDPSPTEWRALRAALDALEDSDD